MYMGQNNPRKKIARMIKFSTKTSGNKTCRNEKKKGEREGKTKKGVRRGGEAKGDERKIKQICGSRKQTRMEDIVISRSMTSWRDVTVIRLLLQGSWYEKPFRVDEYCKSPHRPGGFQTR